MNPKQNKAAQGIAAVGSKGVAVFCLGLKMSQSTDRAHT